MDTLLRDVAGEIEFSLRDKDEVLINADSLPTASVKDSAGAAVAGTYTVTNPSTGVYRVAIPTSLTATLDDYELTLAATIAAVASTFRRSFRVVGAFLFSIAELRAFEKGLEDTAKYTTAKIVAAREAAEERLEELMEVALRRRGRRVTLDGDGTRELFLPDQEPRKLVSVKIDEGNGLTALIQADVDDIKLYADGRIRRPPDKVFAKGDQNVEILFEHGIDETPEPVRDAAMALAALRLVPSATPDGASSLSTDEGIYRLNVEGRDGPTGIPKVDAAIEQFGRQTPVKG